MKTLQESLFDHDLATKDPIDWSYFKSRSMQTRSEIFMILLSLMTNPDTVYLEEWMGENYTENELGFNYIQQCLQAAFKKQGFDSWFDVTEYDFEEVGDEMTEEEIDSANEELMDFFSKAYQTETQGFFLIINKKLPDFVVNIIKCTNRWNPKMESISTWAIEYWPTYGPAISFYGCPRGLDSTVKKLLYNK